MGNLKGAVSGISWMTGLTILTKAVALGKIAILARILTPAQFGAYGIALLALGFLEVLTETGINIFLIQQKDDGESYLNSAWAVSILRGILIAVLIIVSAPFILGFFQTPQIINLFYLIAAVAFIRGFINPMVVTFQKKLEFMKVFIFQGGLYAVDAAVAVTVGILTGSESAMIIGMIAAAIMEVVLSFILFEKRPKLILEKEKFKDVFNSGKWVTGAGIFSYLFQNIDNIVVGRVLGTASLGFYQQSYSLATLPVTGVSNIFNKVLFPVFVKISDDKSELRKAFFKALKIIVVLAAAFGLMIFIFAHPIIILFLGPKWTVIEPTLKVLAVFGVLKSVLNSTYSLFLSLKLQRIVMLSELSGIIGMGIAIYPLVIKFGTVGAGYAAIIAAVFSFPVVLVNIKKILSK
jgi:O-antigen/teichoic acid export membrane protein